MFNQLLSSLFPLFSLLLILESFSGLEQGAKIKKAFQVFPEFLSPEGDKGFQNIQESFFIGCAEEPAQEKLV